jgi:hypothetical protein
MWLLEILKTPLQLYKGALAAYFYLYSKIHWPWISHVRHQHDQHCYTVDYVFNNRTYSIIISHKTLSSSLLVSAHFKDKNVTDILERALGPDENFHGIPTTPRMLGFNGTLVVKYFDFESDTLVSERNFLFDEVICIHK